MKYFLYTLFLCIIFNVSNAQDKSKLTSIMNFVLDSFKTNMHIPGITATFIDSNGNATDIAVDYSDSASSTFINAAKQINVRQYRQDIFRYFYFAISRAKQITVRRTGIKISRQV